MHRIARILIRSTPALIVAIIMCQPTLAQMATPAATPTVVTCSIEPRPIDFIVPLLETETPQTTPTPLAALPGGTAADAETTAAVLAVVEELTACVNAGDYLRAFALYDDAYLRRLIDPEGLMDPAVAIEIGKSLANVTPSNEDDITQITHIVAATVLPDGTVALAVETMGGVDREQDDTQVDLFVLAQISGSWRIVDSAADIDVTLATPTS
ncbi:MAG TPA: hypothetical protein PK819_02145 [Thermomicrobiales bacterium]|nr:hypothetical protein [Thermomicrobiales bacterium]